MSSNDPRNPTGKGKQESAGKASAPARPHPEQAASVYETNHKGSASATAPRPPGSQANAGAESLAPGSRASTTAEGLAPGSRSGPAATASPNAAGAQTEPGVHQARQGQAGFSKAAATHRPEPQGPVRSSGGDNRHREDLYGSRSHEASPSTMSRLALFARERPAVLLGCAVASGFLVTYLLRRSQRQQGQQAYRPHRSDQDRYSPPPGARPLATPHDRQRSTGIGLYPGERPTY